MNEISILVWDVHPTKEYFNSKIKYFSSKKEMDRYIASLDPKKKKWESITGF